MTRAGLRRSFLEEIMYKLNLRMKVGKTHTGEKSSKKKNRKKRRALGWDSKKEAFNQWVILMVRGTECNQ